MSVLEISGRRACVRTRTEACAREQAEGIKASGGCTAASLKLRTARKHLQVRRHSGLGALAAGGDHGAGVGVVQLVVDELALVHVAAGVQVRAVAEGWVRPVEHDAPEMQPVACESSAVGPAVHRSLHSISRSLTMSNESSFMRP